MPFCNTSKPGDASSSADNGIKIFYRKYGRGRTKVLLIIGLAGTHDSWGPQIKALAGTDMPNEDDGPDAPDYKNEDGIEVCAFDNRGMGRSSVPTKKSEYTYKLHEFLLKFLSFQIAFVMDSRVCLEHLPNHLNVGSRISQFTLLPLRSHCRATKDNEKLEKIDSFILNAVASFDGFLFDTSRSPGGNNGGLICINFFGFFSFIISFMFLLHREFWSDSLMCFLEKIGVNVALVAMLAEH